MKIEEVYTGSWFPRTKLHLQEFFYFLNDRYSALGFDQGTIDRLHKEMGLEKINYEGGIFDKISVKIKIGRFEYFEDGLLVFGKKVADIKKDIFDLEDYYRNKLVKVFSFIYSKGAPLPSLTSMAPVERERTTVIVVRSGTDKEVEKLLKNLEGGKPHAVAWGREYKVYFSKKFIVVSRKKDDYKKLHELIRHYIFFREYESQLHKYLDINRYLWDSVAEIFKKEIIKYKELPEIRENLLHYREKNTLIKNRLSQMNNYLAVRTRFAEEGKTIKFLETYKANRFLKIQGIQDYLEKLWQMTNESLESVSDLIDSLYQENNQKELNTLQAIFLIGVTASFLALGAMPGAVMKFFNPNGVSIAAGEFVSFDLITMIKFGSLALAASFIIYLVWDLTFKNLRKFKIITIIRGLNKKR